MEQRLMAGLNLPRGLRAALLLTSFLAASVRPGLCEWQTFTQADGIGASGVSAIAEDDERNLWFANWGVTRYDGATWTTFRTEDGLISNDVKDILVDRDGMIVARAGGGASPSHEIFAASYMDLARRLNAAHEEAEFGSPRDVMVSGPSGAVAFQAVTSDYGLIAVLGPDGILGRVRFELRKAGASLLPELAD